MEADEVDAAVESRQQLDQLTGIEQRVVYPVEHDVLERESPLVAPVVIAQHLDDRGDGCRFLDGHDGKPLFRDGVVQADGQVAFAFVEEPLQVGGESDGGEGDAFGAPGQAIVGHQQFRSLLYLFVVVERFAHSHEDQVGDLLRVGYRVDLVQDFRGGEVVVEPLLASHAEVAVHAAAHL